ncbi:hypothetical protein GCM10019017_24260 [Streptomyces showdoensis]
MELVATAGGGLEQPGLDQLLHHVLGVEDVGFGQTGAVRGGHVGPRNQAQQAHHPGGRARQLPVGQLERSLHPYVVGGEGAQPAFLVGQAAGEPVDGPGRSDVQPVAGHAEGERQASAHLRDPRHGLGFRVGPLLAEDAAEQLDRLVPGHLLQRQPGDVLQPRQRAPAGHEDEAAPAGGQQRAHLSLVARVVQDDEMAPFAQQRPQQSRVAGGALLAQPAVRHPEGLEQLEQGLPRVDGAVDAVQVHHEAALREVLGQLLDRLERQGRLAAPGRTGDHRHRRTGAGACAGAGACPGASTGGGSAARSGSGACAGPPGDRLQAGQLRGPPGEVAYGPGRLSGARGRHRTRGPPGPSRRQQDLPLGLREPEPVRQRHDGTPLRYATAAPLHVADGPDADPRRLGQLLQRQTGPLSQRTQDCPVGLFSGHDSP